VNAKQEEQQQQHIKKESSWWICVISVYEKLVLASVVASNSSKSVEFPSGGISSEREQLKTML